MTGESKNKTAVLLTVIAVLIGLGVLFTLRNRRRAVKISEALLGQSEIAGNAGFTNEQFQNLMKEVGWKSGDEWCVYFAKLVWYNSAPNWLKEKILKKVSGSSLQTWNNLKNDPSFKISQIPQPGDMVIWQRYSDGMPTVKGHAGIVKRLGYGSFVTIEGNTTDGSGSEGYIVAEKTRSLDFTTKNGLRLLGFIRFA